MASLFRITLYASDKTKADEAAVAAFRRVEELDRIMSDYDPQTELMQLCRRPVGEPTCVNEDLFEVLQRAQRISEQTEGAFDVTVGPFVQLWRSARKKTVLPTVKEIAEARKAVGYQKLILNSRNRSVTLFATNMRLDLGGIAKGYAADQALRVLKHRGVDRAMVAASGDIAVGDPPPGQKGWKIGISPIDAKENETTKTVWLRNAGISTSGDTEQFVEINGIRYSHIVDPATGLGLTNRIQATVIARDATTTDSFATALCVLGVKRGLTLIDPWPNTAALLVTRKNTDKQLFASRRFKNKY